MLSDGYFLYPLPGLPAEVREQVERRDWAELDRAIAREAQPGGSIFEALRPHAEFTQIEHIISIRATTPEYEDEDGIWHDDGSRVLAFSLSLTLAPREIEGGRLQIRRRGEPEPEGIPTPEFGHMIVFATGVSGFEHRIRRVSRGERIIIAGWCT